MICAGRNADQGFRPYDHLYFRCNKEDIIEDRLNPNRIRCPDTSTNWSKYSRPWDVIFDHEGFGIVRFIVRELPVGLPKNIPPNARPKDTPKPHSFRPGHVPLENNYAHTEIWTYIGDSRSRKDSLPKTVQKELRQALCDRGLLILRPNV